VPAPLVALMSAVEQKAPEVSENKETITYFWQQQVPVPSYLIALAIGDLKKKDVGPRSCVWTEASMLDACAHEFADTEKFVSSKSSYQSYDDKPF
jgi:leukotriene-A4 hydrolase